MLSATVMLLSVLVTNNIFFTNPLVTHPLYLVCMAKILILKENGIIEKIYYERRAYESVDDRSHSQVVSQKSTENKTRALMG